MVLANIKVGSMINDAIVKIKQHSNLTNSMGEAVEGVVEVLTPSLGCYTVQKKVYSKDNKLSGLTDPITVAIDENTIINKKDLLYFSSKTYIYIVIEVNRVNNLFNPDVTSVELICERTGTLASSW